MAFRQKTIYLLMACTMLASCQRGIKEGMIIFTQVEGDLQSVPARLQYRLVQMSPDNPGKTRIISDGFYSARSPQVSPDGKKLVFSGKRNQNETWQIWTMDLRSRRTCKVTNSELSCTDPAFLPAGRVVFTVDGKSLYTCKTDGTEFQRITYDTYNYLHPGVLADGRILSIRISDPENDYNLTILRPDGTKAALFYQGNKRCSISGKPYEIQDGRIFFTQSSNVKPEKNDIVSINYRRPLHSCHIVTEDIEGSFMNVYPIEKGTMLVSWRSSTDKKYSLHEFDPVKKEFVRTLYADPYFNAIEAVAVEKKSNPKNLPSEVDYGVKTGLLLCQNLNFKVPDNSKISINRVAETIEIMGIDSSLGKVPVEKDGSFYLKVIADTPFRITGFDKNGNRIDGPCGWIYLRPNERRGCIGCHEDPESVPANIQPLAVLKLPVSIPIEIKKIREKEMQLE
jgi:hypothetical protein